jgi:hypothetical protein
MRKNSQPESIALRKTAAQVSFVDKLERDAQLVPTAGGDAMQTTMNRARKYFCFARVAS